MHRSFFMLALLLATVYVAHAQNLTVYRSSDSVDKTVSKLSRFLVDRDFKLIQVVSHDMEMSGKGLEIAPTRTIIFDIPALTDQLVKCNQTVVLDLPLKLLVWKENGDVYIGYIDPKFMKRRFLLQGCDDALNKISNHLIRLVNDSIKQS